MNSDGAKKIGILIAGAMPPPGKLKKSMSSAGDEGESDDEAASEEESGDSGGGMTALSDMMDALKGGDKAAAWDAFCDAVDICANRKKSEGDQGDKSDESDSYKQ